MGTGTTSVFLILACLFKIHWQYSVATLMWCHELIMDKCHISGVILEKAHTFLVLDVVIVLDVYQIWGYWCRNCDSYFSVIIVCLYCFAVNSAIKGYRVDVLCPSDTAVASTFSNISDVRHIIFTAETHNFPTGVCHIAACYDPLSGTTQVSRYQKGKTRRVKPIWIYWSKR